MTNTSTHKHGTQMTHLSVMIGRYSLHSQHGGPDRPPANGDCPNFRYTKTKAVIYLRDSREKLDLRRQQKSNPQLF